MEPYSDRLRKLLFEASHEGIIVGDSYVGIPAPGPPPDFEVP